MNTDKQEDLKYPHPSFVSPGCPTVDEVIKFKNDFLTILSQSKPFQTMISYILLNKNKYGKYLIYSVEENSSSKIGDNIFIYDLLNKEPVWDEIKNKIYSILEIQEAYPVRILIEKENTCIYLMVEWNYHKKIENE